MASIINGVYKIIDEVLDVTDIGKEAPNYRTPYYKKITACTRVCGRSPLKFNCSGIFDKILIQMKENFDGSSTSDSGELWRYKEQPGYNPAVGPETKLEKEIVKHNSDGAWVNQVPTSSGLVGGKSDGKRNIDLVRRDSEAVREYTFYELKVKSDTPLFAAMEIVIYGVLYCLCRQLKKDGTVNFPKGHDLLNAKKIHLRVLAPQAYYERYLEKSPNGLKNLSEEINTGLKYFLDNSSIGFEMDFRFDKFHDGFTGLEDTKTIEYVSLANRIEPLLND